MIALHHGQQYTGNELPGAAQHRYDETYRSKVVRVSSLERSSGTPNSFQVNLGNDIRLDCVISVQVLQVSIPNTTYNVSAAIGNNTFQADFTIAGPVAFAIPDGFYNTAQLMAYIQAQLNPLIAPSTIALTQDAVTNRVTFTITGAETAVYNGGSTFPITSASTVSPFLGMTATTSGAPAGIYTVPSLPSLAGSTMLYVHSTTLSPNQVYLNTNDGNIEDVNGLVAIPVSVGWGVAQTYIGTDRDIVVYGRSCRSVKTFDITLRTNNGRLLDLDPNEEAVIVLRFIYSPSSV